MSSLTAVSNHQAIKVNPARIQFTWGCPPDAPGPWRFWVFCFFRRAKSPVTGNYYVSARSSTAYPLAVIISLRSFFLWMLAISLAAYFGGGALIANWYGKKPFNLITYPDLVLPWRWSRLETLRGQANLAQADANLKDGDLRSAYAYLRSGLARYPDDSKGRLQLATIYVLFRKRPEADKTLLAAYDYTYPGADYFKKSIELIEPGDNPELLIGYCARARASAIASGAATPAELRQIDLVAARTLNSLEHYDEAVAYVEKNQPADASFLHSTKISRALALKDIPAAKAELDLWLAEKPDEEPALNTAIRVYGAAGMVPEMQAKILRLRSLYPENPDYIALGMVENIKAGQTTAALDLLDISVIRFAHKPAVYGDWAEAIGKTGKSEVVARLEQLVRETNQNPQAVILSMMLAQLRRQAWAEAEASSARLDLLYPGVSPRLQTLHRVAKALLETCSQPVKGAQNTLANSIAGGWVSLTLYKQIIDALVAAERYESAQEILTLAEGYYPQSRYILAQRTLISGRQLAQKAALERRNAERLGADAAPQIPADAAALYAELDTRLASNQIDEALQLLRNVRKANPAWLKSVLPEVEWREIVVAGQSDNLTLLQLALRTYLRGRPEVRLERALAQAVVWHTQNHMSAAALIVREVLNLQPVQKTALRLKSEWKLDEAAPAGPGNKAAAAELPPPASARELFQALDTEAAAGRAEQALRLIRSVRRAEPAWLNSALPEIEWREIQLAAMNDDLPLLQLNLRTYLRTRPAEYDRCLTQARTWQGTGRTSAALVAVRESLRQKPDDASAQKLLTELSVK
ncbi:MAG: hypothetical protein RIQ79_2272 [Verrucomicrobiota bacterium]